MSINNIITAPCEDVSFLHGLGNKPSLIGAYLFDMKRTKHQISGVYKLESKKTKKVYIGSSTNMHKRKISHFTAIRKGRYPNRNIKAHYLKYGLDDFQFVVLEYCHPSKLIEREQYYMDLLVPELNVAPNADSNVGVHHTEETKQVIAKTSSERWQDPEYKDAVSSKISTALKGNKNPQGHTHSKESRQKISKGMQGNTNGSFGKGRKHSEAAKAKMRKAKLGRTLSEEHKEKIRQSLKKTHASRR